MQNKKSEVVEIEYICDLTGINLGKFRVPHMPIELGYACPRGFCISRQAMQGLPIIMRESKSLDALLYAKFPADKSEKPQMSDFLEFFAEDKLWVLSVHGNTRQLWKTDATNISECIYERYSKILRSRLLAENETAKTPDQNLSLAAKFLASHYIFCGGKHTQTIQFSLQREVT